MASRTKAGAGGLVALAITTATLLPGLGTDRAMAQTGDGGCENAVNGQECEVHIVLPDETVDLGQLEVPGRSGAGRPDPCSYSSVEPPSGGQPPGHSPAAVPYLRVCPPNDAGLSTAIVVWFEPGEEPWAGLSAVDVRDALWAQVRSLLVSPELRTQPAADLPSIVNIPTFVTITNPQPATRYVGRAGGVEVWIDVWPEVRLHPGEPDAPEVLCDDDGTTFDPAGPPPAVQAEGACAYAYRHRSAEGWDGDVAIEWTVTWDSSVAGQQGTLAADPSVTAFSRIVEEVVTVVADVGD